jgi:hypothetical protein
VLFVIGRARAHGRRTTEATVLGHDADAAGTASFVMAVLYGAAHCQDGTDAGGTEAGRVDRDQAVGFAHVAPAA